MNRFVISVGTYIEGLTKKSKEVASKIGKVNVNMGGTACKVPLATDYINKAIEKDELGKSVNQRDVEITLDNSNNR